MHNYQPYQAVRIVTIQVALPASGDIDDVADHFERLLTRAMNEPNSIVLDWQYLTLLDESPVVVLETDPAEGDAFCTLVDDVPACDASLELARLRALGWWPDD